ncbi:MAG: cyclic nucleotide-binding domain-containing protein [Spirochaetes bacterium]|nr:cyclic nucleotide-binding domain-containing protein [Spirochaetota bacterium]
MEHNNGTMEKPANPFWGNIFSRFRRGAAIPNADVLKLCPIFRNLTNRELKKVSALIYERRYQIGEFLFEKEQPGTAMFIVKTGLVQIVLPGRTDEESVLAVINPEDFLGELALLDDTPRSASAKAVEKTEALAFFREDLNELLETHPAIGSKIMRDLAIIIGQRLKACNEQLYGAGK